MSTCNARQQGDEMFCSRCVLRWSVTDTDPPQCLQHERRSRPRGPAGEAVVHFRGTVSNVLGSGRYPIENFMRVDRELTERLLGIDGPVEVAPGCALPPRQGEGVDYVALLAKYVEHVGEEEGIDFIDLIDSNGRGYHSNVQFTPAELEALKKCR